MTVALIAVVPELLVAGFALARPRSNQAGRFDAPALRSVALLELQPSGPWQELAAEAIAEAEARAQRLVERLKTRGLGAGGPVTEDWGLWIELGPLNGAFGPRDDGEGWTLHVGRGHRPPEDNPPTRQVLQALDEELRALEGVRSVRWAKREDEQLVQERPF